MPGLSGMMKKSVGCPCSSMVVVNSGFGHWQVSPSCKMSPCQASGATLACTARPALLRCVLLLALLSFQSLCWHLFSHRVFVAHLIQYLPHVHTPIVVNCAVPGPAGCMLRFPVRTLLCPTKVVSALRSPLHLGMRAQCLCVPRVQIRPPASCKILMILNRPIGCSTVPIPLASCAQGWHGKCTAREVTIKQGPKYKAERKRMA